MRLLIVDGENTAADPAGLGPEGTIAVIAGSLAEAEEALSLQRFDAVLLRGPAPPDGVAEFASRLRERERKGTTRTPILLASSEAREHQPGIDALLIEHFDLATLQETLDRLNRSPGSANPSANGAPVSPNFDPEEFAAHLGHDPGLIVEIIDLFFVECGQQLTDLHDRLAAEDYERLSRIAHTLKGSLSSLQAPGARALAQQLENAAKRRDAAGCDSSLQYLENSIEAMRPQLLALRASSEGLL